tara:strand:+ start:2973 stop:3149 length:177 start_codon:yes stop_codon:yes gene_type:complete
MAKRTQPYKFGVAARYLAGSKNPRAKAREMKSTAKAYKEGKKIDIKKVNKSRVAQGKK